MDSSMDPAQAQAVYYTLSTISQTLAGALGLFAAFIVLRIGTLEKRIEDRLETFAEKVGYLDPAMNIRPTADAHFDWLVKTKLAEAALDYYEEKREEFLCPLAQDDAPGLGKDRSIAENLTRRAVWVRKSLLRGVLTALVGSASVIVLCFAGLAFAPQTPRCWAPWILGGAVACGAACLAGMVHLMRKALRD